MAVVGSGIMAEELAGGNEAIAFLCNTLPTGAVLFVIITIFVSVSGAHFNPAVSLVMWLRGDLDRATTLAYIAVRSWVAALELSLRISCSGSSRCKLEARESGSGQWLGEFIATFGLIEFGQWLGEFIATFGLIATILGCVRFRLDALPPAVGLYITSASWFTSSTSFANPAVTMARALGDTFAGIVPRDVPGFLVAELLGALAAAYLFGWLFEAIVTPSKARKR